MSVEAIMSWLLSVLNLSNSIIGVSVLSMPFILSKCGIILGIILVCVCGYLTAQSCWLLLQSGHIVHKGSYEMLGYALYGKLGKLFMEISNIGLLFGVVVAMFVIIGDLAPDCIKVLFRLETEHAVLRNYILILMCFTVVLPLSLLRDVKKLSLAAGVSMIIYVTLIVYLFSLSLKLVMSLEWISKVKYFDSSGILTSVSILALAFCCQTTLFLIRDSHNDKSVPGMFSVVKMAISAVGSIYCLIGLFGYITFNNLSEIPGDIIMAFPKTTMAFVVRLLFAGTVILSIPLCVFACRTSLDSLIAGFFASSKQPVLNALPHIPTNRFICITVSIVTSALFIAVYIPNVEIVLQLTGATMGSCVAFIFPAGYYLKASKPKSPKRNFAGFLLMFGMFVLVISTCVTVMNSDTHEPLREEEPTTVRKQDTPTTTVPPETTPEVPHQVIEPKSNVDHGGEPVGGVGDKDNQNKLSVKPTNLVNGTKKVLVKEGSRKEPPIPVDSEKTQDKQEGGVEDKDKSKDKVEEVKKGNEAKENDEVVVVKVQEQKKIMERLDEMQDRIEDLESKRKEQNAQEKPAEEKTPEHPPEKTGPGGDTQPEKKTESNSDTQSKTEKRRVDSETNQGKKEDDNGRHMEKNDVAIKEDEKTEVDGETHSNKDSKNSEKNINLTTQPTVKSGGNATLTPASSETQNKPTERNGLKDEGVKEHTNIKKEESL